MFGSCFVICWKDTNITNKLIISKSFLPFMRVKPSFIGTHYLGGCFGRMLYAKNCLQASLY